MKPLGRTCIKNLEMNFTADSGSCTLLDNDVDGTADDVRCDGTGLPLMIGASTASAERVSDEDGAWTAGIELGSSTKIAKIGFFVI